MSGYYHAQVCLNGHPTNEFADNHPEHNQRFCPKCGAATITACPSCATDIRSHPKGIYGGSYTPPAFCEGCGKPLPWTESRLQAANELIAEVDQLTEPEKETLTKSLDDLVRETPNTALSVIRFKKLAAKAGLAAASGLKEILVGVISEAVKRQIWGS